MDSYFTGKRALVTGAAGGIGSAVVEKLIEAGAEVIALDNSVNGLKDLKLKFPNVEPLCVDLLDWEATRSAAEQCSNIEMLVNGAGVIAIQETGQIDERTFDWIIGINTKAVVNLSQVIAQKMKANKTGGAIVNISSQASRKATTDALVYAASKAALDMITKCMALEFGPHKIRVNAVNPTAVNTALFREVNKSRPGNMEQLLSSNPLGRIAEPEEIADAVLFLLSDKAQMINGAIMPVDGGSTV